MRPLAHGTNGATERGPVALHGSSAALASDVAAAATALVAQPVATLSSLLRGELARAYARLALARLLGGLVTLDAWMLEPASVGACAAAVQSSRSGAHGHAHAVALD